MSSSQCPVCGGDLLPEIAPWHLVCVGCRYEGSSLQPSIVARNSDVELDEGSRETALRPLRQQNFQVIAAELASMIGDSSADVRPTLLDVGCAHGWFIEACNRHFDVTGIEPDSRVAKEASERVGPIREGFFPDVLLPEERFDVIAFNDVLEHIPDVADVLLSCNKHLSEGGMLVVNAPNRLGALYRISKVLARVGRPDSFCRMWQHGFPSPHVHYFDARSIAALAAAAGFEMMKRDRLPSVLARGLYSRIRYSSSVSPAKAGVIALGIGALMPILRLLPPDIEVWYFRKRRELKTPDQ